MTLSLREPGDALLLALGPQTVSLTRVALTMPEENAEEEAADTQAAQATAGDPQQFLLIYERHYERILNYLYRRTGDRELASDLASRTFLNALQFLQSRPIRHLQVKPWLSRIATTEHLQHLRSQRRWVVQLPLFGAVREEIDSRSLELLSASSEQRRLLRHLHALPEKYRTPLLLRYYEELSFREIGSALGLAEASARSRVSRALEKLSIAMREM